AAELERLLTVWLGRMEPAAGAGVPGG
ncbi:MarR family transcriptional regulator, partial [Streptomyces sp. ZEA17I]